MTLRDRENGRAPPLEAVHTALAVQRTGSFSAAADVLDLTHGAVSRRVAALEAWVGRPLFERRARGVHPTPDGQRFLSASATALDLIEDAAGAWSPRRAEMRISCTPSFAKLVLLPNLQSLEDGSGARIEVVAEHRNADLEAGEADIAVRCGTGQWRAVTARRVASEQVVPIALPRLASAIERGSGALADELLRHTLLHDSDVLGWRTWLGGQGRTYCLRPKDRRFEDYTVVLAAAAEGLGIALARLPVASEEVRHRGLVTLGGPVAYPRSFHVLTRQGEGREPVLTLADTIASIVG